MKFIDGLKDRTVSLISWADLNNTGIIAIIPRHDGGHVIHGYDDNGNRMRVGALNEAQERMEREDRVESIMLHLTMRNAAAASWYEITGTDIMGQEIVIRTHRMSDGIDAMRELAEESPETKMSWVRIMDGAVLKTPMYTIFAPENKQ